MTPAPANQSGLESCAFWQDRARGMVAQTLPRHDHDALRSHLASCSTCRKIVGDLVDANDVLRQAFRALEQTITSPSRQRVDGIVEALREPSETSRLLRRTRRSVNTLLWIAVLALSLGSLAALAWWLYRLVLGSTAGA